MKPLSQTFRRHGFNHRILIRDGDLVLVEKSRPHWTRATYEVCRVQFNHERVMAGRLIEATESLPSAEAWGSQGWSFRDRAAAQTKLFELIEDRKSHHDATPS